VANALFIVWEIPLSASPKLAYGNDLCREPGNILRSNEVPVSESLNGSKSMPLFSADNDLAQTITERSLNLLG